MRAPPARSPRPRPNSFRQNQGFSPLTLQTYQVQENLQDTFKPSIVLPLASATRGLIVPVDNRYAPVCQPGTFRGPDQFVPCTLCNLGEFQEFAAQKNCELCPKVGGPRRRRARADVATVSYQPARAASSRTVAKRCTHAWVGIGATQAHRAGRTSSTRSSRASRYRTTMPTRRACPIASSARSTPSPRNAALRTRLSACARCALSLRPAASRAPAHTRGLTKTLTPVRHVARAALQVGFFNRQGQPGRPCEPCPENAVCRGGTRLPSPLAGFYAEQDEPFTMYRWVSQLRQHVPGACATLWRGVGCA